jgi:hypothetical protein
MAIQYPLALDNLINPSASDSLNSNTVPHHLQHANLNDAVEAIQTVLGVTPAGSHLTVKDRISSIESNISSINGLGDVTITDAGLKDILVYTESGWVNKSLSNLTKSADISINGGNF